MAQSEAELIVNPELDEMPTASMQVVSGVPMPPPPRSNMRLTMSTRDAAGSANYVHPTVPAFRTSPDGRVALSYEYPPEEALKLTMLLPEAVNTRTFTQQDAGLAKRIVSDRWMRFMDPARIYDYVRARFPQAKPKLKGAFLCTATEQPTVCAATPGSDCYALTLVQQVSLTGDDDQNGIVIGAIPLTVTVAGPKTIGAAVSRVDVAPSAAWKFTGELPFADVAEKITNRDGRLVVGRLIASYGAGARAMAPITYELSAGGSASGDHSLFYSYATTPCDPTRWFARDARKTFTNLRPLAAAHRDTRLVAPDGARYGFAAQPLRDSNGLPFAETAAISGSYPWMDKNAANVFFFLGSPALFRLDAANAVVARFPFRRVDGGDPAAELDTSPRGLAVAGSWTNGKTVLLDGLLNNDDFASPLDGAYRYGLYKQDNKLLGIQASGGGRFSRTDVKNRSVVFNSHYVESVENVFNMHAALVPSTPRDVVWNMTRGMATDEIAFDDFMDPHVLLFAEMNAAWENTYPGQARFLDGFDATTFDAQRIRLQNAATSRSYPIASRGLLEGSGRVEPVAAGGIRGRGLWLSSASSARFAFPAGAYGERNVYLGVFVDGRTPTATRRHLLSFESTSGDVFSVFVGDGRISVQQGTQRTDLAVPGLLWTAGWHHLGISTDHGKNTVDFLIDGNHVGAVAGAGLRIKEGTLHLGGGAEEAIGLGGWFDDLRVVVESDKGHLHAPSSPELLCNYARGGGISVGPSSPAFTGALVADVRARALGLPLDAGRRWTCKTNYASERALDLRALAATERSERGAALANELHAGAPRPDQTSNAFCTSCHVPVQLDAARPLSLLLRALTKTSLDVSVDPRLQPMQPPAYAGQPAQVWGVIPAGWLTGPSGEALPPARVEGPANVLEWVLP